jgi:predicted Ser/Thr protein kinase
MDASDYLDRLGHKLVEEFEVNRRVMSFEEYLDLFVTQPRQQIRTAAQYLLDCFNYFGTTEIDAPLGTQRRWNLFDVPFDGGRNRLVGQEAVQDAIYRIVENFTRQGVVNKMILLHGPNGSAKSSLLACLGRALEAYSMLDEGAVYQFNWVFPTRNVSKKQLGFGGESGMDESIESFAFLDQEDVDARIPGDLRDHPILLLPVDERRQLLEKHFGQAEGDDEFQVAEHIRYGELSPRNRQIAELLYNNYRGDLRRVLQHVQVERFFMSRRYRRAVVTVEPQLQVDANVRQLTGDRSLTSLPQVLQSTTLYEPFGDLVDAHRGLIEYNDLLKRPLESFKYLISTCEKSNVSLTNQILHLDVLFFASSNENHLSAFKEYPDWPSFKARIDLVRVPYIRDYRVEMQIYDEQVGPETIQKRIAPHTTYVAALWAVLTRLNKPQPDRYPKALRATIASLTPLEKAELYSTGRTPLGLTLEKARLLRQHLGQLADEEQEDSSYEGQIGASPREMKAVLLNAAQREEFPTLSPLAVIAEISELCKMRSVYEFLRMEPEGQYGDHESFIGKVRGEWLDLAEDELARAMGLVTRDQYDELFRRYLTHVSHEGRSEKLYNSVTGVYEEPDRKFMEDMEKHFQIEKAALDFRSELLGRIGAASKDSPLESTDYRDIFPSLFSRLEDSYYDAQRPAICASADALLKVLSDDTSSLSRTDEKRARETLQRLIDEFGYCEESAKETVSTLVAERYNT